MKYNKSATDCIEMYIKREGENGKKTIVDGLRLKLGKGGKYSCPNSTRHKNGDEHASMSWDNKKLMMYCFTCGHNINVYSLYKDYMGKSFMDIIPEDIRNLNSKQIKKIKNEVRSETQNDNCQKLIFEKEDLQPLTKHDREYLNNRGLTDDTLKKFKVCSTKYTYKKNKNNELEKVKNEFPCFVYFDNMMKVIGLKYRAGYDFMKYSSYINSNFNLYGKHLVDYGKKEIHIIEGECDSMILKQNFPDLNVVSIPTGANSLERIFEKEEDFFNQFNKIVVIPDNDKAGKEMLVKFEKKFSKKVETIDFKRYKNENDISDLFLKYGYDGLKSLLRSIISNDIDDMGDYDVEPEDNFFIDTGFNSLDDCLNGIQGGTLTIVGGFTGSGKTTWIEQVINYVIGHLNLKVLRIDGEHRKKQLVYNTYLKLMSDSCIKQNSDYVEYKQVHRKKKLYPNEKGNRICRAWAKGKSFFYTCADIPPEDRLDNEKMFDTIHKAVKYDEISLVVLDNLMSINNEMSEGDQFEKQKKFVARCQSLAKRYNVAVILICHMKKPPKNEKVNEYTLFGSSMIPNYADNILYIRKATGDDMEKLKSSKISGIIEVLKNREESELKEIYTVFEPNTKMLYELDITDLHNQKPIPISFNLKKYLDNEVLKQKEAEPEQTLFSRLGLGEVI